MSNQQKYTKDNELSNEVAKTKVSHGKIETAVKVRSAKSTKELDLELKRLHILQEIERSTIGKDIAIPSELQNWQQLILIVGYLNLRTTTEILLACKKLGYSGTLKRNVIKDSLAYLKKDYFQYDKEKGWQLTNKGQTEFSRLKQFI